MRIGIKYCGGCNPRYDRSAFVGRLRAALPELDFEPVQTGTEYDLLLLVSGCHVECADLSGIGFKTLVRVFAADQLDAAIEALNRHSK